MTDHTTGMGKDPARSGLVVAGGRSRRFGDREKALAPVAGRPMLRRVADSVVAVTDELVVNCRGGQRAGFAAALPSTYDARFAVEEVTDRGPLYGLRTGLTMARGEYAAVLACDLPRASPELVARLFEAADAAGAVPVVEGVRQPLCAVYRVGAARAACETTIAAGDDCLQAFLDALDPAELPESAVREVCPPDAVIGVNTPVQLCKTRNNVI